MNQLFRQTRCEAGTQSQGSRGFETARLPAPERHHIGEVSHEGEIDALHHRNRAPGYDGDEPRRRDALVGLTMHSSDPVFGPVAGHRWH